MGVVDGTRTTFDEAFRAEYADIVRVVAPIVGSVEDAEAVVQDAFLKAFTRWRRVGGYDRPGAWVQRVAIRDAVYWERPLPGECDQSSANLAFVRNLAGSARRLGRRCSCRS